MPRYQVVVKRIVSSNGKIIAEAKSIASAYSNGKSEINQSISVTLSSDSSSSTSISNFN
ncbi:hypothetical protein IQ243_13265 [Nostocales cyanobacterium LEGE 11386]|nr:hypothetical protein [Nostocales cyanobacterium LEGE 11386]